jgi:hypothetical protein
MIAATTGKAAATRKHIGNEHRRSCKEQRRRAENISRIKNKNKTTQG